MVNTNNKLKFSLVLIILIILTYSITTYLTTYDTESFWISFNGKITLNDKDKAKYEEGMDFLQNRPYSISISHNVQQYRYTYPKSFLFSTTNISWISDTEGIFEQSLFIPSKMDLIIEFDNGESKVIKVDEKKHDYNVTLYWKPYDEEVSQNLIDGKIDNSLSIKRANILNLVDSNKVLLNSSQIDDIQKDIRLAEEEIVASLSNGKIINPYYAYWFFTRAEFKIKFYSLANCAIESEDLVKSHNPLFYNRPYEVIHLINTSYGFFSVFNIENEEFSTKYVYRYNSTSAVLKEINSLKSLIDKAGNEAENCRAGLNEVRNVYSYQEPLFFKRLLFLCVFAVLIFSVGYLSSRKKETISAVNKKWNLIEDSIKHFFNNINLQESRGYLITVIIGLLTSNIMVLQIDNVSALFQYLAIISIVLAAGTLLLAIVEFFLKTSKPLHKLNKWILISLFMSLLFFPFLFDFVFKFVFGILGFIKEVINFVSQLVTGKW